MRSFLQTVLLLIIPFAVYGQALHTPIEYQTKFGIRLWWLKDSPENSKRPHNVTLHHDTSLYQDIWVDPHLWNFLVIPEWFHGDLMIVSPFKVNGKTCYHYITKYHRLPSSIAPDSSVIIMTWWYTDSLHGYAATDEIRTLANSSHFMEAFHRPPGVVIKHDTGFLRGILPESDHFQPQLWLSNNSFSITPPFLVNDVPSYREIAGHPSNGVEATHNAMKMLDKNFLPCNGCPPFLRDSALISVTYWNSPYNQRAQISDEIRVLHK